MDERRKEIKTKILGMRVMLGLCTMAERVITKQIEVLRWEDQQRKKSLDEQKNGSQ